MKFDARKLRRSEISKELADEFEEYLTAMTTRFDEQSQEYKSMNFIYDRESNTLVTYGRDRNNILRRETYYAPEYLKLAREYEKIYDRINKQREQYDINEYRMPHLSQLIERKSRGKVSKGLENIIKSGRKILGMESTDKNQEPVNMIRRASENRLAHDKIKFESFDNPDNMMKEFGHDVSKYKKANGAFKSKKLEREYMRIFSNIVVDEYEVYEGDFYGWTYEKSGGVSVKNMDAEEHKAYYQSYIIDTLESKYDQAMIVEDDVMIGIIERKLERIKNK